MLVAVLVFGVVAACTGYQQSADDDLRVSTQETEAQSTPVIAAVLSATASPTTNPSVTMKVTISCQCPDYNHVGNEWSQYFNINEARVNTGKKLVLTAGETIVISTEITEYDDAKNDTATSRDTVEVTADDLEDGFSVTQTLHVKENGGRYTGNIAVWTVVYTFTP